MPDSKSTLSSAERMFDVLDCFLYEGDWMLTELSQKLNLPTTTTFRLLQTLEGRGFVERIEGTKRFTLGKKLGEFNGAYISGRFDLLRCAAIRPMEFLSKKHNETVRLFVRDGGQKLCIEAVESTQDIRHIVNIGERHDLIRGAAGKLLFAYMPAPQRQALLGETDSELNEKIERAYVDGYAVSIGERDEGLSAVSAPIFSAPEHLIAVISLSGPTYRFSPEYIGEKIKDTIECADKISNTLMVTGTEKMEKLTS